MQPVLSALRVGGNQEQGKDNQSNLSHQSIVRFECNRTQNGLLNTEIPRGIDRMRCRVVMDSLKLQLQISGYEKLHTFLKKGIHSFREII